jgi:hypothetical protein
MVLLKKCYFVGLVIFFFFVKALEQARVLRQPHRQLQSAPPQYILDAIANSKAKNLPRLDDLNNVSLFLLKTQIMDSRHFTLALTLATIRQESYKRLKVRSQSCIWIVMHTGHATTGLLERLPVPHWPQHSCGRFGGPFGGNRFFQKNKNKSNVVIHLFYCISCFFSF